VHVVRFLRKLSLNLKVTLVVVVTLGTLLVAIVVLLNRNLRNLTVDVGQQRAEQEVAVIQGRFKEAEGEVLAATKQLAACPGLVEALAVGDSSSVIRIIVVNMAPLGFVDLVDTSGRRIAAGGAEKSEGFYGQEDSLLSLALLGIETTGVLIEEESGEQELWLAAAVPLRDLSGTIIGAMAASREVDDEFLVDLNLSRENPHLALAAPGDLMASDLPQTDVREDLLVALSNEAAIGQALAGQTVTSDVLTYVEGVPYATAYAPLTVGSDTRAAISILVMLGELSTLQRQLTTSMTVTFAILALLTVAAMALFGWRGLGVPLRRLANTAQAITQGDLEIEAQVKSDDEIGLLASAFNQMTARLREMLYSERENNEHLQSTVQNYVEYLAEVARGHLAVRLPLEDSGELETPLIVLGRHLNETTASLQRITTQIRDTASNLSAAASEILTATTQQSSGASEQSAAISEASSTITEVCTIADQTAQRAQGVTDRAQRTTVVSKTGQQVVVDTITGMEHVKERVESIAAEVLALSEQTQTIGQIIATVNEIAAQSNMLALNAAVEAARAGEAGQGFAVVAQEVRSLAEQSRAATTQVKDILSEIQRGVNAAVMATESGVKGVDAGMKLAGEAGLAINELADSVTGSAQAATQIAAEATQQLNGMEQIAQAMENIHQATAQSLAGAQQTERAAEELNDLARQLRELVEQYQL
jgi:methyl-accepting chemotaxis protein